jgi:hypothetical protein
MKVSAQLLTAFAAIPFGIKAMEQHGAPSHARELLDQSMQWLDGFYDPRFGYLHDVSGSNAMRHNTRSSSWYALGLLARNGNDGDDVVQAETVIAKLAQGQFKDPRKQWYGDYQKYPEEPEVGSPYYAPVIYKTWDPNVSPALNSASQRTAS